MEPAVSIGAVQGEEPYVLVGAIDATILGDGRIVVANGGTSELRVFDATGIHHATWGGRGEGPGEFGGLHAVERWPGDSIIAWYTSRLGITAFDAQGNYGRVTQLPERDRLQRRRAQNKVEIAAVVVLTVHATPVGPRLDAGENAVNEVLDHAAVPW